MVPLPAPVVRHLATPAWEIHARTELGLVRRTMQDSFVLIPNAPCSWQPCDAIALFDGVGGLPRGAEAAHAAATGLHDAVRRASAPEQVFTNLQERVLETGGATTGVVALLAREPDQPSEVLWSGDSSAYALDESHGLLPLAAADSEDGMLTHCLGLEGLQPHAVQVDLAPGKAILLCTDGVDGVVGRMPLQPVLEGPPPEDRHRLDQLFSAIAKAGAHDNATAILARRRL